MSKAKDLKSLLTKHVYSILLIVILLVGFFLRFYNTPARYGFDPDAVRDAIISDYGASTFQFPATGPTSTLGDFHFGPWYYYKLIAITILIPSPYAPWIYMGVMSMLAIVAIYFLGKILEGEIYGLILAGIATVSPALIAPATGLSNPNNVILHGILCSLLFVYILKKTPAWWWGVLFGIDLGFGINAHFQFVFYLVLPLLLFLTVEKKRFIYAGSIALGFFLTLIPFLWFDLTHSFKLANGIIDAFKNSRVNKVANSWKIYLIDFWPEYFRYFLGISKNVVIVLGTLTIFVNIYLFAKKKLSKPYILLAVCFLFMFVGLKFYSGERYIYYLLFLDPLIIVFLGMLFYSPFKFNVKALKYVSVAAYITLLGYVLVSTVPNYHTYDTRIDATRRVNQLVKAFPKDKFAIYSCRNIEDFHVQGVMFVLGTMNKLDPNGRKIGMILTDCTQSMNIRTSLINSEMTDLSSISNKKLARDKWVSMTPAAVYDHYARWYTRAK